jgi:hypothetical protein
MAERDRLILRWHPKNPALLRLAATKLLGQHPNLMAAAEQPSPVRLISRRSLRSLSVDSVCPSKGSGRRVGGGANHLITQCH